MNFLITTVILSCAVWGSSGYPYYPYYYGNNFDTLSYGASDSNRGGMVLSRYYNPYYSSPGLGGGMAAFMFRQPEEHQQQQQHASQPSQYYLPDRRRQTPADANLVPPSQNDLYPPQQNEVYPQLPEKPYITELTDLTEPTPRTENLSTTPRVIVTTVAPVPEITEPEAEEVDEPEPVKKPRKRVSNKKQVKRPVEEDDEEDYPVKMPQGTFFPMFFGWGGRSSNGAPGGATAIANAYSTGRGGVATSHATAFGPPGPQDTKYYKNVTPGNK